MISRCPLPASSPTSCASCDLRGNCVVGTPPKATRKVQGHNVPALKPGRLIGAVVPVRRALWVPGAPVPQPRFLSKSAKGSKVKAWRQAITEAVQDAGWQPWPRGVAMRLVVWFFMPRPGNPSYPWPTREDADNLFKALDALNGRAYADDCDVVDPRTPKIWAGSRGPGVLIVQEPVVIAELEREAEAALMAMAGKIPT